MKLIALYPLEKGLFAKVDDEDYDRIIKLKWKAKHRVGRWYAFNDVCFNYTRTITPMHRFIMQLKYKDGKVVDHADRNGLNNQKPNLRVCDNQKNAMNSIKPKIKTASVYKGVSPQLCRGKISESKPWRAYIKLNRKQIWLGSFQTEKEAAVAYNKGAQKYFGEYALLNVV